MAESSGKAGNDDLGIRNHSGNPLGTVWARCWCRAMTVLDPTMTNLHTAVKVKMMLCFLFSYLKIYLKYKNFRGQSIKLATNILTNPALH